MKIHDVTLTLRSDMPTWPGEPGPILTPISRIVRGDPANVSLLALGDHTGTHVDPPLHFIEGGAAADELPVDALIGPCRVVAFGGGAHVSAAWLQATVPAGTRRLLIKTRNSERRPAGGPAGEEYIALDPAAAAWLVRGGVSLVGIDGLSIEKFEAHADGFPVHRTLLAAGVVVVEGLDLGAVAAGEYELFCGPLKLAGGDGAPARVFLVER